ncbi:MAG: hypothetical protein M1395_05540 [Bacteroidetes bacterium]|jgi:hypothetical protein|nr:hypothetical protein [Bacteroidota bacterium]
MGVNPVSAGSAAAASATQTQSSTGSTSSTSSKKKDAVVLSQKAKDLAAQLAGKSTQEEMNESVAAKMQEGPNS